MAKKQSEVMAKEIIETSTYRADGKVVVIDSSGGRTVYNDVIAVKGLFFGGIKLTTNSGSEEFDYSDNYEINGISCKV